MASSSAPRQRGTPVTPGQPLRPDTTATYSASLTTHNDINTFKPSLGNGTDETHRPTKAERPTSRTVAASGESEEREDPHRLQEEETDFQDMDACFKAFDKDEDGFLSENEFGALCRALFRNDRGKPYPVDSNMLNHIFQIFDTNKDHVIDKEEFRFCWQKWIKQVVRPVTALLVVDVQNDFISGSLSISNCPAGQHGEEVICPINRLLDDVRFDIVVYTLDWHPENHVSFIDNVHLRPFHTNCKLTPDETSVYDTVVFDVNDDGTPMEQKMWPKHCVQNSWGAELHEELKMMEDAVYIHKGTNPDIDSYSAFWDNNKTSHTSLHEELQKKNVTDVFVCGIATDVCVAYTAKHALEEGYRTMLIDDACRGVCDDDIKATMEHTVASNGLVVQSTQVKSLASGRDRPPVLAYRLALELAKKMKKK
ncbi:uncharacterized protein LOC135219421 [Macrobrachium nipponense]|uniref:uncharacterized protein LOC135219421 n=1 Tax=Macrobrachium nipponense TaxID=159736 RepID=UPI0030C88A53